jgi:arylsulfatase A-like enzyme
MPEAPRQLLQLFQSSRAGHGSLIAEHMEVPIAASVALPDAPIRRVDLMPTILERLDVTVPSGVVLDGVPFSKIVAPTEPLAR